MAENATSFDPALVELKTESHGENDEGDYDTYKTSTLLYGAKEIWRHSTSEHSNIGGAWGESHTCELSEDKRSLTLVDTEVGGTVGSGGRSESRKAAKTVDIVKLAA